MCFQILTHSEISITLITPMGLSFQMYSINVILQGFAIESKCFTLMANLEMGILIALGKSFFSEKGYLFMLKRKVEIANNVLH